MLLPLLLIDFYISVYYERVIVLTSTVVGDNKTLQLIFDKTANLCLNQINHVKNQQNCYLYFLFTNIYEDFCVSESLNPLWKNEAFHTAIELSIFIHGHQNPNDFEYEEVFEYQ